MKVLPIPVRFNPARLSEALAAAGADRRVLTLRGRGNGGEAVVDDAFPEATFQAVLAAHDPDAVPPDVALLRAGAAGWAGMTPPQKDAVLAALVRWAAREAL